MPDPTPLTRRGAPGGPTKRYFLSLTPFSLPNRRYSATCPYCQQGFTNREDIRSRHYYLCKRVAVNIIQAEDADMLVVMLAPHPRP